MARKKGKNNIDGELRAAEKRRKRWEAMQKPENVLDFDWRKAHAAGVPRVWERAKFKGTKGYHKP